MTSCRCNHPEDKQEVLWVLNISELVATEFCRKASLHASFREVIKHSLACDRENNKAFRSDVRKIGSVGYGKGRAGSCRLVECMQCTIDNTMLAIRSWLHERGILRGNVNYCD